MSDRYEGQPFLRLLECFVLWSIDQLPVEQAARLEEMAPRLASVYGRSGSWQDIVANEMEFSACIPDALRGMWERTLDNVQDGTAVDPEVWARQVVDSNFN
jgi:hypothetical protein